MSRFDEVNDENKPVRRSKAVENSEVQRNKDLFDQLISLNKTYQKYMVTSKKANWLVGVRNEKIRKHLRCSFDSKV